MGSRSWLAVTVCVVAGLVVAIWQGSTPGLAAPAPSSSGKPTAVDVAPFAAELAGRASCSGRACHASLEPASSGIQQNEFTSWINHDKHARAFEVLGQERAKRMAKNLGIESAEKDVRCLACHTTPQLAVRLSDELAERRADGVSCEACHGPAKGADPWLSAHTMSAWSTQQGKAREEAYHRHGMTALFDLEVQTKTCAGCHVGAPADPEHGIPARDLNHDLMAAGHPRLTFELGTFRANMPPHWRAGLHANVPGFEASVWAVGQVGAAKASVDLLAHRAQEAAASKAPWPEFAESSCFACHADLRNPSWRRNSDYYSSRRPGAIPVNRWYTTLLPALDSISAGKAAPADKAIRALAKEMDKPYPDAAKVEALAKTASADLATLLNAVKPVTFDAETLKKLTESLARQAAASKEPDWDATTQAALAAAAIRDAASRDRKPEGLGLLDDIFRDLAFPPSYESPETYAPHVKGEGQSEDLQARLLKVLQEMNR